MHNTNGLSTSSAFADRVRRSDETDDFIDLENLWTIVRRQTKVVAASALIAIILGVFFLRMEPPTYQTQAQILIDANLDQIGQELTPAPVSVESDAALLSRIEVLKSLRLALTVVDAEDLTKSPVFLNPPPSALSRLTAPLRSLAGFIKGYTASEEPTAAKTDDAAVNKEARSQPVALPTHEEARRTQVAQSLRNDLEVGRVGRTYVITLSYESNDPELAYRITNAYVDAFFRDQQLARQDASRSSTAWMQKRLNELRQQKEKASTAVAEFRATNNLSVAKGELVSEQSLSQLASQLVLAQSEVANASARVEQMKGIIASDPESAMQSAPLVSGEIEDPIVSNLRTKYLSISRRIKDITDRWGDNHPQAIQLRNDRLAIVAQTYDQLQRLAKKYANDLEVARNREAALDTTVQKQTGNNSKSNIALVKLNALEQQANTLNTLYEGFLARYEEAVQKESYPGSSMRLLTAPDLPDKASGPRFGKTMVIALALGIFAGCGLGALNEFNERFFRVGKQVRDDLGQRFLGYLPAIMKSRRERRDDQSSASLPGLRSDGQPESLSSVFAETLRNAKLASDVLLSRSTSTVIGVISALPEEGKSTVAANFAELLSVSGRRTILIDGDMRKPGLSRVLTPQTSRGLVDAALGTRWRDLATRQDATGLTFLPSVATGNMTFGSDVLASAGMRELLDTLRGEFDYIVVDLPPFGPVVDAKAFEPLVDGFLLVVQWGRTPRALLRSFLASEPDIAAKLVGVILNKTKLKALKRYGPRGSEEHSYNAYRKYYSEPV